MIKGKNTSIVAVIIIMLFSLTSCGKRLDGKEIVRYMEKKYDEKFTYVDVTGGQLGGKSLTLRLEPEKYPGEIILASCELKKDGDKTWKKFNDNYMGLVFEEQTQEVLEKITKDVYGECKVFYSRDESVLLSTDIGPKTKFSEYASSGASLLYAIVLDNSQDLNKKDEKILELIEKLKENKVLSSFRIEYLKDDNVYDKINVWEDVPKMGEQWFNARTAISLDREYNYKYEWSKS